MLNWKGGGFSLSPWAYSHLLECELDFTRFKTRNLSLLPVPPPKKNPLCFVCWNWAVTPPPLLKGCRELLCSCGGHTCGLITHFDAEWPWPFGIICGSQWPFPQQPFPPRLALWVLSKLQPFLNQFKALNRQHSSTVPPTHILCRCA